MIVGGHRSSEICLHEYFCVVGAVYSDLQVSKLFCAANSSPQKTQPKPKEWNVMFHENELAIFYSYRYRISILSIMFLKIK